MRVDLREGFLESLGFSFKRQVPAWQGKVLKTSPLLCLCQAVSGPATPVVSCLNSTGSFGSIFGDSEWTWCRVACSPVGSFNFSFLILTSLKQHYAAPFLSRLRVKWFFFNLLLFLDWQSLRQSFSQSRGLEAGFCFGLSGQLLSMCQSSLLLENVWYVAVLLFARHSTPLV